MKLHKIIHANFKGAQIWILTRWLIHWPNGGVIPVIRYFPSRPPMKATKVDYERAERAVKEIEDGNGN